MQDGRASELTKAVHTSVDSASPRGRSGGDVSVAAVGEVVVVVALYTAILIVLSLPFVVFQWPPTGWDPATYPWGSGSAWYAWRVFPYNVFPFE